MARRGAGDLVDMRAEFHVRKGKLILLVFCFIGVALTSLYLSAPSSIISTNIKFLLGSSLFSYSELRRELFVDSAWYQFAAAVRFSLVPILAASIFGYLASRNSFLLGFFVAIVGAIVSAIQLNKFFYLYYLTIFTLVGYSVYTHKVASYDLRQFGRRHLFFILIGVIAVAGIYRLYLFQYSEAIASGLLDADRITATMIYRVFYASADALHLWVDYFLFESDPKGLSVIGRICATGLVECFDANSRIPQIYLGEYQTTLQVGFIGTGLAMGGIIGAIIVILLTVLIVFIADLEAERVMHAGAGAVVVPLLSICMFFLCTRDLHTATLSGGLVFALLYSRTYSKAA
ncbi:hypothetical protein [Abyssibacter profundi]|uniref:Uncharacterized protein n=1 Tax=Abyssibacter profundi TaxID=2182787 RepID=A0A383XPM4_9GAMM|nr:hypothetical protein [Abyssibacter profundi]PWN54578.1 hypothetical protein DEH80_16590 [Abyssibacter profundi]